MTVAKSVKEKNISKYHLMPISSKVKLVACKLTSPELRKRKQEVIAVLKGKILIKAELKGGYQYAFEGSDGMIDTLVAFIKMERQCCNFLCSALRFPMKKRDCRLPLQGRREPKNLSGKKWTCKQATMPCINRIKQFT